MSLLPPFAQRQGAGFTGMPQGGMNIPDFGRDMGGGNIPSPQNQTYQAPSVNTGAKSPTGMQRFGRNLKSSMPQMMQQMGNFNGFNPYQQQQMPQNPGGFQRAFARAMPPPQMSQNPNSFNPMQSGPAFQPEGYGPFQNRRTDMSQFLTAPQGY